MQPESYLLVLNNFENLFKTKKNYDVIIQAGEENNQKEIYAHSIVLRCQSNYFDAAFSAHWARKKDGKYFLKKPNISPHTFETIIRYYYKYCNLKKKLFYLYYLFFSRCLYCGQMDLNMKDGWNIFELSVATDELGLDILHEYIKDFIINNQNEILKILKEEILKKEILKYNLVEILEMTFHDEAYSGFEDCFLEIILKDPEALIGTGKMLLLSSQICEKIPKI